MWIVAPAEDGGPRQAWTSRTTAGRRTLCAMGRDVTARGPVLIAVLALLWGSNFAFIEVSLDGFTPT